MIDKNKETVETKTETTKIGFLSLIITSAILVIGAIFVFKITYKR